MKKPGSHPPKSSSVGKVILPSASPTNCLGSGRSSSLAVSASCEIALNNYLKRVLKSPLCPIKCLKIALGGG